MIKTIKKYFSGSLKIVLAGIVAISANTALANSNLTKSENYFPGAKYDLFNGGRFARQGSKIVDVNNHIQVSGSSFQAGSVLIQLQQYSGGIEFERSFENHPLSEHGSWSRSNSKQLPFFHGNISSESLGIGVSRGTIYGVEIHPEDAYDAKDGGDHPYDIYNYRISGSSITTSIHPLDLPTLLPTPPISPYNGNGDGGNGQAENGSPDGDKDKNTRNDFANENSGGENNATNENGEVNINQDETKNNNSLAQAELQRPQSENPCGVGDCVIRLNDHTQQYGGQLKQVDNKGRNPLFNPSVKNIEDSEAYSPAARKLMDEIGRFSEKSTKNIGKQKKGKPQSNVAQNKQFNDAAKAEKLNKEQKDTLKKIVENASRNEGENLSYHDIRQIAREVKNGRHK